MPSMRNLLLFSLLTWASYSLSFAQTPTKDSLSESTQKKTDTLDTNQMIDEVVISSSLKEVSKLDSPVAVEVYSAGFFRRNPESNLLDALGNINGVRPQLNCNICGTGDIHIGGLEGPYTLVLIDGMPLMSGLGSVYGLSGIPQSLIDRVEVVKGPASTLFGSEAVGGLINVITKKPTSAPKLAADISTSSWAEINADVAAKFQVGEKATTLLGVNQFRYENPADHNQDGFTDLTLQDRISIFNSWSIERPEAREFRFAARYLYEDRWGGEINWNPKHRGGDEVYGESIYLNRAELFSRYQLPTKENLHLQVSASYHAQNSAYGNVLFHARQGIFFSQLLHYKTLGKHDLVSGLSYRYTYYDDNTPITANPNNLHLNEARHQRLPGLFVQDEWSISDQSLLLMGLRYDYNSIHGSIVTPRIGYKFSTPSDLDIFRINIGSGYRVAEVFTEDHAALTGAREIRFKESLKPETSWNININYVKTFNSFNPMVQLDFSLFHSYFTNKILASYDEDPSAILFSNLKQSAVSRGGSLAVNIKTASGFSALIGGTFADVFHRENEEKIRPVLSEKFSGNWTISYPIGSLGLTIDYTGSLYSPMRLPLLSDTDPRSPNSPWWSVQNLQLTKKLGRGANLYFGVKNLLNFLPTRSTKFLIARAFDPFDRGVEWDPSGNVIPTASNPYALTFDPSYVYAPNQGRHFFLGFRYEVF